MAIPIKRSEKCTVQLNSLSKRCHKEEGLCFYSWPMNTITCHFCKVKVLNSSYLISASTTKSCLRWETILVPVSRVSETKRNSFINMDWAQVFHRPPLRNLTKRFVSEHCNLFCFCNVLPIFIISHHGPWCCQAWFYIWYLLYSYVSST